MKSLKRIIAVMVAFLLIMLISTSLLTMFYYRNVFNNLEKLNYTLDKTKSNYVEMDLPIKVLHNIIEQLDANGTLEADRIQRLTDAYMANHEYLIDKVNSLNSSSGELVLFTQDFLRKRPLSLDDYYKTFEEASTNIQAIATELTKPIEDLSLYYNHLQGRSETIDNVNSLYLQIQGDLDRAILDLNIIRRHITDEYMLINLWTFFVLIVIAFILATILTKLLRKNIPFIIEGFKKLDRHDYNLETLPQLNPHFDEEKLVKDLVVGIIKEQRIIDDIKKMSGSNYLLADIIESIFHSTQEELKSERIGIAFVDYNEETIIAEHGVFKYNKILLGPGFKVDFKDTSLTELLKSKRSQITTNINKELTKRPHSSSLRLLVKEGVKSNMIIPIIVNDIVVAFIFFSSINENNYDLKGLRLGENIAYELSSIINKSYLTQRMFANATKTFADIVEKKDFETGDHIKRMTSYSKVIAEALLDNENINYRVSQSFIHEIENNAAVHDIGKVGIPDKILNKPGKLTDEEWRIMKEHTIMGAEVLLSLKESLKIFNKNFYESAIDIARSHHEKWDGTGYPDGLSGENIPLAARIIAIADVFDAISSKRVYKDASSFEETVAIINASSGKHFDPELVKVFNSSIDAIKEIYEESNVNKNWKAS